MSSELDLHLLHLVQRYALQTAAAIAILFIVKVIYSRLTRFSISKLPGPEKSDWLLGNLTDLNFEEVGIPHFSWQQEYGPTFKIYGIFGDEHLMISDPKAVQHVYSNASQFIRQKQNRALLGSLFGPGLIVVDHEDHKRQRKVMQPAFGIPQVKALFPLFLRHSQNLMSVLKRDIDNLAAKTEERKAKINIHDYVSRATLDIIGDAAFDYQFGSLNDKKDPLRDAFHALEDNSLGNSNRLSILTQYSLEYVPIWLVTWLTRLPIKKFARIRSTRDTITTVSDRLVKQKHDTYLRGLEGGKDLISLLVRANAMEEDKAKLSNAEVNAEISTIMLAGHGTTANTVSFGLWELAKNVDMQTRLRAEINKMQQHVKEQGRSEIGVDDYEHMPLLNAFIKETLRCHPIAHNGNRVALQDCVIPVSQPVKLSTGEIVTEIPVSKGQNIQINIPGYNRLPELFGENSYDFDMNRWLDSRNDIKRPQGLGMYASLITFGHGPRACIGWRFAVWEMSSLLIDLLSNFEFKMPNDSRGIQRIASLGMLPGIKGDRAAGSQLPLDVTIIRD